LPTHAGNDRASYGFGAQTGRCAPGPAPSPGRESARPGAGEQWQREVLLAAFAAPVRQRKVDGGVGLQDAKLNDPIAVLLPAAPAGSRAVRVEQGVPRQAEQAVEISQDHLGLVVVGVEGVGRQPPGNGASDSQKIKTSMTSVLRR